MTNSDSGYNPAAGEDFSMRLPARLFALSVLVLTAVFCSAESGLPANSDSRSTTLQTQPAPDNMALVPQVFIPPRSTYKGQIPAVERGLAPDAVCYNIHSVVVAEDDHTGVTRKVGESTCTRATRFQTKNADTPK